MNIKGLLNKELYKLPKVQKLSNYAYGHILSERNNHYILDPNILLNHINVATNFLRKASSISSNIVFLGDPIDNESPDIFKMLFEASIEDTGHFITTTRCRKGFLTNWKYKHIQEIERLEKEYIKNVPIKRRESFYWSRLNDPIYKKIKEDSLREFLLTKRPKPRGRAKRVSKDLLPKMKNPNTYFPGAYRTGLPDLLILFATPKAYYIIEEANLLNIPVIGFISLDIPQDLQEKVTYPILTNPYSYSMIHYYLGYLLEVIERSKEDKISSLLDRFVY